MSAPTASDGNIVVRARRVVTWIGLVANGLGASVVIGFMLWAAPNSVSNSEVRAIARHSLPVFAIYLAITLPLGEFLIGRRPLAVFERWVTSAQAPSADQQLAVLRYPARFAARSFGFWLGGALTFLLTDLKFGAGVAWSGLATIALGGLTACSLQYVLVERTMRPVTRWALAHSIPDDADLPGVALRVALAWLLATGVPILGIAIFAIQELTGGVHDPRRVAVSAIFLAAVALTAGLGVTIAAAASVAAPLRAMRAALRRIDAGDLDTRVDVEDGSEVGLLQAGFNQMMHGLAERQRLREAFGTFVDPALADQVLAPGGVDLDGTELEVTVLFLDIRDFTAYAEQASPREVVTRLNDLYGQVVPIITARRGHTNKFIGDGLLAVFGAPNRVTGHEAAAVNAAREIVAMVRDRYQGALRVGVGVNTGPVVAGTIGGGGRLDFTVIGDTVNTASRVEAATKSSGDDLLITAATLARLQHEPGQWVRRPPIELRGKHEPIELYAPA